jgi:hypothetical protein
VVPSWFSDRLAEVSDPQLYASVTTGSGADSLRGREKPVCSSPSTRSTCLTPSVPSGGVLTTPWIRSSSTPPASPTGLVTVGG